MAISCKLTIEDVDSEGEQRLVTMGQDFLGRMLVVVYTERSEDKIRLISARKASPRNARHTEEVQANESGI